MGKINAYVPEDKHKSYSSPTTKPLKSGFGGYHEKGWSLQEQIHIKLEKTGELIQELLLNGNGASQNRADNNKANENYEILCNDLEHMENTLKNAPTLFNKSSLQINPNWIIEMKEICENTKQAVADQMTVKKLGKLEHTLTELGHLIKSDKVPGSVLLLRVEKKARSAAIRKPTVKNASAKTSQINNVQERPAAKVAAQPTAKPAAKPKPKSKAPAAKVPVAKKKAPAAKTKKPAAKTIVGKKKAAASAPKRKPAAKPKAAVRKPAPKAPVKKAVVKKAPVKKAPVKKAVVKKKAAPTAPNRKPVAKAKTVAKKPAVKSTAAKKAKR